MPNTSEICQSEHISQRSVSTPRNMVFLRDPAPHQVAISLRTVERRVAQLWLPFRKEPQKPREKSNQNDLLLRMHRLKSESDFARLAKSRKTGYAKSIGVKVRENKLPYSRFGIVVGLKISKKAVERNLLKRRVKDILKKHLEKIEEGYDIMVLIQKSALNAGFDALEADCLKAIEKVGLLKKKA